MTARFPQNNRTMNSLYRHALIRIFLAGVCLSLTQLVEAQAPKPPAAPPATPPATPPGAAPAAPAPAPEASSTALNAEQEMEALYSEAATAFNQTKYDVALQKLGVIHQKTSNKEFEKVMFLEGACLYNMEQFDKAADMLGKFVEKFPTSEQISEAKMALGRALMKADGTAEKGIAVLKDVAAKAPTLKAQAGLEIASYYKKKNELDPALEILKVVTEGGANSPEAISAVLMMAEIYVAKSDTENANAALEKLTSGAASDESVVQINQIRVKIGDEMLEAKRYREALMAYQGVRRRSEILKIQKSRVDKIEQWLTAIGQGRTVFFLGHRLAKDEAESMLKANKSIVEEIEKMKDFDAVIFYKLALCFFEMGRQYESELAFKKIYEDFKEFPDRDRCLFGMIMCNTAVGRTATAYGLCKKYLSDYPDGKNIMEVTNLFGELAYKSGNIKEAVSALQAARGAKGADKERIDFFLGSILFEAQQFDDSRTTFMGLVKDFPKSVYRDDCDYRIALTYFFENKSKEARKAFRDYIANNPKGQYVVDAKYRLAFIEYQGANTGQGGNMQEAVDTLETLARDYPNDQNIGQVWSLLGDIYGSRSETKKAQEAYKNAFDKAKTEDVVTYVLDNLTNLLVSDNNWAEVANVWGTYYSTHKDSPLALKAIYWISRAKQREGKPEDAEKLIAGAVMPHMANPSHDQVEVLLQQLVTLMVPKKHASKRKPAPAPAAAKPAEGDAAKPAETAAGDKPATDKPAADKPAEGKPAEPAPAPAPAAEPAATGPTFAELEERLKKLLTPEGEGATINGTHAARVLYARALLARLMKDIPKFENLISIIPDAAKVEELSPLLLSTLAEMLLKKGDTAKAESYFNRIREAYADGEFGDKAPVGLGRIQLQAKNYDAALKLFDEAISKYPGSSSMLDATIGKADALFHMKKLPEAEKLYMLLFQTREWRGEPTSIGLYGLGQIEEERKEWMKAVGFYNRLILSQQKYKSWLAKAYLRCANCWVQLDKKEDAVKVLRDMLGRKDVTDQPEFQEAQQMLAKISG